MKINTNNFSLIWILLGIVVIMSIIKIKYGYRGGATIPEPNSLEPTEVVTATPTSATSSAEVLKVDETKYPLWQQLPYSGVGFTVEKYTAPKVLRVQLNGATQTSAIKAINVWLKAFGNAGTGHKIEFEN